MASSISATLQSASWNKRRRREKLPEPIQNIEAEQALLGAILVNNEVLQRVAGIVTADDFADPVHGRIFAIAAGRIQADTLATPATLKAFFEDDAGLKQLGGPAYLARLAGAAIAIFAARDYAEIIAGLSRKRQVAAVLAEALDSLQDPETDAGAALAQIEAFSLTQERRGGAEVISLTAAASAAIKDANDAVMGEGRPRGTPTGLDGLDRMLGGLHPGEMIVLGGRPGHGKSSVALSIATHAASSDRGVAFVSLEMDATSLARRAISEATAMQGRPVPYAAARKGTLSEAEMRDYLQAAKDIHTLPIIFTPPQCRDLATIYATVKRIGKLLDARGAPLGLVVIDYVQLVRVGKRSRYEEVTEISIALKSMALQLNVPVLALAQLNRGVDSRDDKRPLMADLKESGQLEQDADVILFAFREEQYIREDKTDDMTPEEIAAYHQALYKCRGIMEIIVAKQRNGETGTIRARFDADTNFVRWIN